MIYLCYWCSIFLTKNFFFEIRFNNNFFFNLLEF